MSEARQKGHAQTADVLTIDKIPHLGAVLPEDGHLSSVMVDHHERGAAHALGLVHQQVAPLRIRVIRNDHTCRM